MSTPDTDLLAEIAQRTVEAEAEAEAEAKATAEDKKAPPKKAREWRGKSAAEMMANRGRVSSTTDVHTGGAKEVRDDS